MNSIFIIYIYLLFLFLSHQLVYSDFKNKFLLNVCYSVIFTIIFYLSYNFFKKETFTVQIESSEGVLPLVNVFSKLLNSTNHAKNYEIKNEFDMSNQDIVNEDYDKIVEDDIGSLYKAKLEAQMSLEKAKKNEKGDEWVISPIIQKTNYDRTKQKDMYCAADFNSLTACCGQPPAKVSPEFTCSEKKPYCNGYVAFERWGTCEKEKNTIESFSDCRDVEEMVNGEPTIIGRFGQFVIWNMNNKTQIFSSAKILIDNAGFLLLNNEMVPALGNSEFQEYNIKNCIEPIVNNYINNKIPPNEKAKDTLIVFPGMNEDNQGVHSYSNDGSKITTYSKSPFDWNQSMELTKGNVFFILIDPNKY